MDRYGMSLFNSNDIVLQLHATQTLVKSDQIWSTKVRQ